MRTPVAALIAVVLGLTACSGDDDAADGGASVGSTTATEQRAPETTGPGATSQPADDDAADEPGATDPSAVPASEADPTLATAPTTPAPPAATGVPDTVPETGVPGLDSTDLFCAAWSRFGGTWQVLLVGSTFLEDPALVARWEVSSAPLVVGAYSELLAQLPPELDVERDALVDGYFGVLERRAREASDALFRAGANGGDVAALSGAWLDALAARDPSVPSVPFIEPESLVGLVDVAADDLQSRRTPFHQDPSLIVTVETPLTDTFIESTCPDQGTLAGGEVGS